MADVLMINGISKRYKSVQALSDIHLEIGPGLFGLLGPNGAGKSTLMKILATLLPQDSGTVSMGNVRWSKPDSVRRILAIYPRTSHSMGTLPWKNLSCTLQTSRSCRRRAFGRRFLAHLR